MKYYCSWMLSVLLFILSSCGRAESSAGVDEKEVKTMKQKVQIQFDDIHLTAVMYDNAAAGDFVSRLPLTLTLEDYNATEKIAVLPEKISVAGSPDGFTPEAGDIAYYAPWGNLAVFYRDFRYSEKLVLLGKIEQKDLKFFRKRDRLKVTFSLEKTPEKP